MIKRKTIAWTLIWIFLMNILFYGLHYLSVLVPVEIIKSRTRDAFQNQNLVPENYPRIKYGLSSNYTLIGLDQFTDGLVIQMALYRHPSKIRTTFLPKVAMPDVQDTTLMNYPAAIGGESNVSPASGDTPREAGLENVFPCENVRLIAFNQASVSETRSFLYPRYWWGQKVILSLLLPVLDYFQLNNLLKVLTYFSFAMIGFLILMSAREWFWPLFPFLCYGTLFSGTAYYGGLTDSTSFLSSLLFLIVLLIYQHHWQDEHRLSLLFVVLGSLAAFIYSMRGGLMLFCSIAFFILYFITFQKRKPMDRYKGVFICLAFFFTAFFSSFIIRQFVSALWLGWRSVFGAFFFQLKYRIGIGGRDFDHSLIQLFNREFYNFVIATYNSRWLAHVLIYSGILVWILAAGVCMYRIIRKKYFSPAYDFFALCVAVIIVFTRIVLLKNHSYVHAWFIGRYMFLPLSFGWTALILTLRKRKS